MTAESPTGDKRAEGEPFAVSVDSHTLSHLDFPLCLKKDAFHSLVPPLPKGQASPPKGSTVPLTHPELERVAVNIRSRRLASALTA